MRKQFYLAALAAIGALTLYSCNEPGYIEEDLQASDSINLVLSDRVATRSAESTEVRNHKYALGKAEDGVNYSLIETVTSMEDVYVEEPETKGSPVYTENFQKFYGSDVVGAVYGATGSSIASDGSFELINSTKNIWRRYFGYNPFETSDPLTLVLHAPASPTGLTNLSYDASAGAVEFDYETPATAAKQQDVLFAVRSLDEATYKSEFSSKGGAEVLFRHALTGIKFAIGNNQTTSETGRTPSGQVETFITKVEFEGLKNKGHVVFVPSGTETNVDDRTEFSSAESFTWTDVTGTNITTKYTQTYSANNIQDYEKNDDFSGPDSFYAGGADRNLNDANASLTFWFIPQEMTDDVKLNVTFYVWDGAKKSSNMTLTLDLGTAILAQSSDVNVEWKAGQLRTFKLVPTVVDVEITDKVSGKVKSEVVTRNTGNKDAYLRVVISGNWVNAAGQIVAPWDESQGTFVGLGGSGDWVEAGGFWYFKEKVAPGDSPNPPIFTKYTAPSTLPSGATTLVMDIAVQAIDASINTNYATAWATATNIDDDSMPVPPGDDDGGSGDGE